MIAQWGPKSLIDRRGNAVPGAVISIYESDGTTLASLFANADGSVSLANPIPTSTPVGAAGLDDAANLILWAEAGEYQLAVSYAGTEWRWPIEVGASGGASAVDSVNGQTGAVVLGATDVGADPAGTASTQIAALGLGTASTHASEDFRLAADDVPGADVSTPEWVPLSAIGLLPGERNCGQWDAGTSYVVGDVVGASYFQPWVAVAASTGQNPESTTGFWESISARAGMSMAVGPGTQAAELSTAVGVGVKVDGQYSVGVGEIIQVLGQYAVGVGAFASAMGDYSTAVGYQVQTNNPGDVNLANLVTGNMGADGATPTQVTLTPGMVDLPDTTATTDPASGAHRLVARSDGLHVRDSAGVETGVIGAAGPAGSPSTYELRGSGSPYGVVTPPGAGYYYTDTAGTLGAWRWMSTGVTSTSWIVVQGDTGWRDISGDFTPSVVSSGQLFIRRVVDSVLYRFEDIQFSGFGGPADTFLHGTALPVGLGTAVKYFAGYSLGGPAYNWFRCDVVGGKLRIGSLTSAYRLRHVSVLPPDARYWPTSLPGIAA